MLYTALSYNFVTKLGIIPFGIKSREKTYNIIILPIGKKKVGASYEKWAQIDTVSINLNLYLHYVHRPLKRAPVNPDIDP